jgi:hypothetical protein
MNRISKAAYLDRMAYPEKGPGFDRAAETGGGITKKPSPEQRCLARVTWLGEQTEEGMPTSVMSGPRIPRGIVVPDQLRSPHPRRTIPKGPSENT